MFEDNGKIRFYRIKFIDKNGKNRNAYEYGINDTDAMSIFKSSMNRAGDSVKVLSARLAK